MMPFHIVGIWIRGLISLAIPIVAIACLVRWYEESSRPVERVVLIRSEAAPNGGAPHTVVRETREIQARSDQPGMDGSGPFRFEPGWNRATAELAAAIALLTWAIAGASIAAGVGSLLSAMGSIGGRTPRRVEVQGPDWLSGRGPIEADEPQSETPRSIRTGRIHRIRRPDGTELHVETYGPDDAPPIVLTHGWGANSDEWYYQKRHLAGRFRLIVWDLPGLGESTQPADRDFSLEKMAADLEAVVDLAGGRPAVLVGHSIGGMILLTYSRLFAAGLGRKVAGLAIVHSSYKDPIQTVPMAWFYQMIRVPVIVPLLRLTIAFWPIVMLINWLSYANGSLLKSTRSQSFAGPGTRQQADFLARMMARARPDVLARGMFGMMAFDESATLPTIAIPTLVVIGDRDKTTAPEAGHHIADHVPGAHRVVFSPARHLGLFEYHGPFDQILADFTASCTATTSATSVIAT